MLLASLGPRPFDSDQIDGHSTAACFFNDGNFVVGQVVEFMDKALNLAVEGKQLGEFHFRNFSSSTQSPGARSYCQNFQPLHACFTMAAPATEGDV